jgi:mutator protein MutT
VNPIRVVAAVLRRGDALLVGRRPDSKRHGGMWEFPGGKIDPGETPTDAARRELAEELELTVTHVGDLLHSVRDEHSPFVIEFYPVESEGEPVLHEHSEIAWLTAEELTSHPLAPADEAFVQWLATSDARTRQAGSIERR